MIMKGTANRERKNPVRLMKGYIYKLTDTRNGKIYIGQHQNNTINDDYYGSGIIVKAIRRKYGKDVFKKTILITTKNVSTIETSTNTMTEYSSITELIENLFDEKWTRVEHEYVKKTLNTNKPYRGYILNKR